MLTAAPIISPTLWTTLCVGGIVALSWYGWRRPGGVERGRWMVILTLMGLALGLVLVVLLNPMWAAPAPPPPGRPLVTILVDSSASMGTPDGEGQGTKTRYAAAAEAARVIERAAKDAIEVRVRVFDEKVTPVGTGDLAGRRPAGQVTDIAGSVLTTIEPDRPQGQALVLLTDGIQTGEGGVAALREAARFAKAAGVPVYGGVFGGQAGGVDAAIEGRSPREVAFIGQKVMLAADVRVRGFTGPVMAHLLAEGKEIEKKEITVGPDGPATVRFEVRQEKVGLYPYEMRIDAVAGELTDADNSVLCLVRVVDKPLKVMLLEGKPYWDSKFLMRQLSTDASVEMHSLVQMAPGRVLERVVRRPEAAGTQPAGGVGAVQDTWQVNKDPAAILADPAALAGFGVLILGRDTEEFLSEAALANVQRWLSREGGALICYRGSPVAQVDAALGRLLPVKWQTGRETRYQLRLTETGRGLNWFGEGGEALGALPPLVTDSQVQQTKPLAVVVARGGAGRGGAEDSPAVTYQPYGAGRVVVIEGAGMWRWAFPPPKQGVASEETYGAVWHALFRWLISDAGLVPGETAAIRPDKTSFGAREAAGATVLTRVEATGTTQQAGGGGKALALELRPVSPAGAVRQIPCAAAGDDPGAYRATFGVLTPGRYEATLSGDAGVKALFDVKQFGEEELNLTARPDILKMIGEESGGGLIAASGMEGLIPQFKAHLAQSHPARILYATAWDRWWIFGVVLVFWAAAWALRRASGLV